MNATLAEPRMLPRGVSVWAHNPSLYEINTWTWVSELARKYRQNINLSCVPVNRPAFYDGRWSLYDRADNSSFRNLLAWTWGLNEERYLIIVNLSDAPAQGRIQVPWAESGFGWWYLIDLVSGAFYERDGNDLRSSGLYVELGPWNFHFLQYLHTNDAKANSS